MATGSTPGAPTGSRLTRIAARVVGTVLAAYLRLVMRTSRIAPVPREQVVIAFWHEYNLASFAAAVRHRGDLPHASFTTGGFRGSVIAQLFRSLLPRAVVLPLPAERDRQGARRTTAALARLAAEGYSLVVTPDGPFGPYRRAKPGALILARSAGLPILPWAVSARPSVRLARRWDRQILPLPFSRIRVITAEPITLGPRERIAPRLGAVQSALDTLSARIERRG